MHRESKLIRNFLLMISLWAFLSMLLISRVDFNAKSAIEMDLESALGQLNDTLLALDEIKRKNEFVEQRISEFIRNNSDLSKENQKIIDRLSNKIESYANDLKRQEFEPSQENEFYWRRIRRNVLELVKFIQHVTTRESYNITEATAYSHNRFVHLAFEHKWSIFNDLDLLREEDGYNEWRRAEYQRLTELIQKRIHHLQNPPDCSKARKLICDVRWCGFGCQMHHLVNCLTLAYGTKRTLVLRHKHWYYHKDGFYAIFKPISGTCIEDDSKDPADWPAPDDVQTIWLNNTYWGNRMDPRPLFMPSSIPSDLIDRITKLHGFPPAWWVAQFVKYIYKLRPEYQQIVEDGMKRLGYKKPIVGVHVRRTDKVTSREGGFHPVDEYFAHVEDFYGQLEMVQKVDKRRVYLATDDPAVIAEAREKYPHYEIIVNEDAAKVANYSQRYSEVSIRGLLLDIHLLSRSDHLICTFTSHICRLSYEHMQLLYPDAAHRYTTIEAMWFTHESPRTRVSPVIPERNRGRFKAEIGDILEYGVWQNLTYGHYLVRSVRLNISDQIPIYKVKDIWDIVDFPTYPEA